MKMVYKRTPQRKYRWLFGLLIFVLGMTLTLSEAHGFSNPPRKPHSNQPGPQNPGSMHDNQCFSDPDILPDGPSTDDDTPPPQVPEPGTLILLGSGLAAAYAARRKNK